jgi:hypothetical protein
LITILAILTFLISFFLLLRAQNKDTRTILEIGPFFLFMFSCYYVLPAFGIFVLGSSINEGKSSLEIIDKISWLGMTYISTFSIVYLIARGRGQVGVRYLESTNKIDVLAIICFIILVSYEVFFAVIKMSYQIPSIQTYGDKYNQYFYFPLVLRQIINQFLTLKNVSLIFLVSILILKRSKMSTCFLVLIVLYQIVQSFITQARTSTVVIFLICLYAINYSKKQIANKYIIIFILIGFISLSIFGIYRAGGIDAISNNLINVAHLIPDEFIAVFNNAYFLMDKKLQNELPSLPTPGSTYISDLLAFIPSQLTPWEKWDASKWYVETFFPSYAEIGGGLAFGAIAEAIVNYNFLSAALQAVFMGLILGLIQRRFMKGKLNIIKLSAYIFLVLASYSSIRISTFWLVDSFIRGFIIPTSIIYGSYYLLKQVSVSAHDKI